MKNKSKWVWRGLAIVIVAAALAYAFRPQPVPVDLATAERGGLIVTVADDGETRVREVYLVSAPLPGQVLRFEGDVGDARARAGDRTHQVCALPPSLHSVLPVPPSFPS